MQSRGAKIKVFSWARQWALATGIMLLLIASPQVWAGIACLCDFQLECEDSYCQTVHRSDANPEMQGESSPSETSTSCENTKQATTAAQVIFQSPPLTACCVTQPQSELPARFVPAAPQVGTVPAQSADCLHWSTASAPAHIFNPLCRSSKHPFYLAFSCLLI